MEAFKQALARVQSDYGFYIDCQTNPAAALAGYDLSPDERSALTDPEKLAEVFRLPWRITITISGKHDWVNRARATQAPFADLDRDANVVTEVEAINRASTDEARTGAAVRLMELIG